MTKNIVMSNTIKAPTTNDDTTRLQQTEPQINSSSTTSSPLAKHWATAPSAVRGLPKTIKEDALVPSHSKDATTPLANNVVGIIDLNLGKVSKMELLHPTRYGKKSSAQSGGQ